MICMWNYFSWFDLSINYFNTNKFKSTNDFLFFLQQHPLPISSVIRPKTPSANQQRSCRIQRSFSRKCCEELRVAHLLLLPTHYCSAYHGLPHKSIARACSRWAHKRLVKKPTNEINRVPQLGPGGLPEWLSTFNVSALLQPDFSLVVIDAQATWLQALETLAKRRILSAPIFDRDTKTFIGLVDVLDLLSYAMRVMKDVHIPKEELSQWAFKSLPVKLMKDISLRNPWCPTYIGKPLSSLVDMFSSRVSLHRVPLVDDNGKVVGLASQSGLIQFLAEHRSIIGSALQTPIAKAMTSPVYSVKATMKTVDAFEMLLKSRVNALAAVDDDGRLVSQLSASDLKGAAMEDVFSMFDKPLHEFLSIAAKNLEKRTTVLSAYPDQTLSQAISLLASSHHIHRIFVLSDEQKPIGVLTMGDVMEAISSRKL